MPKKTAGLFVVEPLNSRDNRELPEEREIASDQGTVLYDLEPPVAQKENSSLPPNPNTAGEDISKYFSPS